MSKIDEQIKELIEEITEEGRKLPAISREAQRKALEDTLLVSQVNLLSALTETR